MPGSGAVSLVNAGLEGFGRAAAGEAPRHIRVNVVSPGWVTETLKKCAAVSGPRGIILGLEDDGALTEKADLLVKMVKEVRQ